MSTAFWIDLPQARYPLRDVCTGGRPLSGHLRQAHAAGVRTVVNLCVPSECGGFDEQSLVEALGMRYVGIPIGGPADLDETKARRLAAVLDTAAALPVLLHCAGGNRAGALLALKAGLVDELPLECSIALGRAAGLSSLESEVRCILQRR